MIETRSRKQSGGSEEVIKTVQFSVLRYDPKTLPAPRVDSFNVPVTKGLTVLDGLHYIKENLDSSLAWRYSCRMGVCGSCGMFINSYPRLACNTQVLELKTDTVHLKPLPNFDIIKDLVPDLSVLFEKHRSVRPFIVRRDVSIDELPSGEFFQSVEELERYLQFTYCIKCGLCMAACPTVATDRRYLGPQPLTQAYRYDIDSRDDGSDERKEEALGSHGAFRCHFAGACSEVCPKGVDPALGIQLSKRRAFVASLGLLPKKRLAAVAPPVTSAKRREGTPDAPERTVR
ncbi:MAG: succinate dehydrogenase/fumarate reductase iron-sulfur subunit [Candidatus Eiseniibacteriota bacterium]|nr:MAG: succinate dehydrogenase/fumarate reductase iron-sulfur subunit [Candidatus Eisenbacteria bacterium]